MRNADNGAPFIAWLNAGERLSKYIGAEPVSDEPRLARQRAECTSSTGRSTSSGVAGAAIAATTSQWARRLQQRSRGHPLAIPSSSYRTLALLRSSTE
jgi:hypothetical protein